MDKFSTDILIVGGGPAGMSAAIAALENGHKRVSVVDDNPYLGGQIWRQEMGKIGTPIAEKVIKQVYDGGIDTLNSVSLLAQNDENSLLGEHLNGSIEFRYKKLVIATGARERFLPFPGWTLPNVFGAGGLQALVKNGFSVDNKRIAVAGTGPLLLVVAEYLASKGAKIVMISEQANRTILLKFGIGLWKYPKKLFQALSLQNSIYRMGYAPNSYVLSAEGGEKLEAVNIMKDESTVRIECDLLASGFHLVPNTELAMLLGGMIENGSVSVDDFQETSIKDVFCAGEPTGIGGVEKSLIEGEIAGLAAVGKKRKAEKLFPQRQKLQIFVDNLNETFALREELKNLPNSDTIVCRCEDVEFGKTENFTSFRSAKLQTRFGMGACQGRICGSACEFLFDWKNDSVRPPIFPVKLENLVD